MSVLSSTHQKNLLNNNTVRNLSTPSFLKFNTRSRPVHLRCFLASVTECYENMTV